MNRSTPPLISTRYSAADQHEVTLIQDKAGQGRDAGAGSPDHVAWIGDVIVPRVSNAHAARLDMPPNHLSFPSLLHLGLLSLSPLFVSPTPSSSVPILSFVAITWPPSLVLALTWTAGRVTRQHA
jgi:hypothetical protein